MLEHLFLHYRSRPLFGNACSVVLQSMIILTLTGQYSRKVFRGLSVGHIFLLSIGYITMWLFNLLGCSWIWLASVEGKENSWMQVVGQLPLY